MTYALHIQNDEISETLGQRSDEKMCPFYNLGWNIVGHGWGSNRMGVMGSGQKFVTRVGSGQPVMGFEFGKFPLKMLNIQFFLLWVKKNLFGLGQKVPESKAGRPLIYCGSKVSLGRVRAHGLRSQFSIRCISFQIFVWDFVVPVRWEHYRLACLLYLLYNIPQFSPSTRINTYFKVNKDIQEHSSWVSKRPRILHFTCSRFIHE